jgi:diguanylate cyclase (GGDEF)-like protein
MPPPLPTAPLPGTPFPLAAAPSWVARLLALRRWHRLVLLAAYLLAALALLLDLATGPAVPFGSLYLLPLLLAIAASRSRWHPYAFAVGLAVVAIVGREVSLADGTVQDSSGLTVALRLLTNLLIYNLVALVLQALLRAVVALEGYARALEQAHDQAWHLALTDPLTGLANRRPFAARLAEEIGRGRPVTVLLLDVDRLKEINDRWGHAAGDVALGRVGTVLRQAVRPGDLAARLGGDEFAVLLPTGDAAVAKALERRVRDLLATAREPDDPWGVLGVSIGAEQLTLARDGAATDELLAAEAVLAAADRALYRAKALRP